MLTDFLTGLTVLLALFGGSEPTVGAFSDPFLSVQLATGADNGECLTTDGTNNAWGSCGSGSSSGFSTTSAIYFVDASTTIPKTYSNNTFTGINSFTNQTGTTTITGNFAFGPAEEVRYNTTEGLFFVPGIRASGGLQLNGNEIDLGINNNVYPGIYSDTSNQIVFQSDSNGSNLTRLSIANVTGEKTFAFPNWTGELVVSTSTTQVSTITATTSTATSTFAGGLTVGTQLGIGTNAPSTTAHIYGPAATLVVDASDGITPRVRWQRLNGQTSWQWINTAGVFSLQRSVNQFSTIAATDLTVGATGHLGISSTSPAAELSVLGEAHVSGKLFVGGQLIATSSIDFGDAVSFEVPNGTAPTVDAVGEVALDTTSNYLLFGTSTNSGGPAVLPPFQTLSFTYATATAWSGTTTLYLGPALKAQEFKQFYCETNAGTLGVSLNDGTNRASYTPTASTTINLNQITGNNSFTAGESRRLDIGTPASSPTRIACTFQYVYTRD